MKSVYYAPDGNLIFNSIPSNSLQSGFVPILTNLQTPALKTVYVVPDGTYVQGTPGVVSGLQGPSTRTVNIGPDGNVIDSFSVGGVVTDDGNVIAPSLHSTYGHAVDQEYVQGVVPSVIPVAKSFSYTSGVYSGLLPIPYGKNIIAGPSGTIVAK